MGHGTEGHVWEKLEQIWNNKQQKEQNLKFVHNTFRAIIKGRNLQYMLRLSVLDFPMMLWVKLPVLDRIHPKINKFATSVENDLLVYFWIDSQPLLKPFLTLKIGNIYVSVQTQQAPGPNPAWFLTQQVVKIHVNRWLNHGVKTVISIFLKFHIMVSEIP